VFKITLVTVAVGLGVVYGPALPAHADVSAECWKHLAEIEAEYGIKETPAADRRHHRERGEYSPCTEQDAQQSDSGRVDNSRNSDYNDKGKDRKSKYCRKTWWC